MAVPWRGDLPQWSLLDCSTGARVCRARGRWLPNVAPRPRRVLQCGGGGDYGCICHGHPQKRAQSDWPADSRLVRTGTRSEDGPPATAQRLWPYECPNCPRPRRLCRTALWGSASPDCPTTPEIVHSSSVRPRNAPSVRSSAPALRPDSASGSAPASRA